MDEQDRRTAADGPEQPGPGSGDAERPSAPLVPESGAMEAARARSSEPDGPPTPEVGALLAWLTRWVGARTAVEVGSAAGLTGLWLLRGLAERGVLTSVEPDAHRHGLAAQAFSEAGVSARVRAIEGDPTTVLPRLADGGYDLVLLQQGADPEQLQHALRLVREDGLVVVRGAGRRPLARAVVAGLVGGNQNDPLEVLVDDPRLDVTLLPLDDGLLLARRTDA